ncbi:uncharacterized protein LOC126834381 [Adelges cooleyi]|uniref:uncharacterized protein LOC126834381 n=1 Tax=Adelges cooleyi TaxID=133065 RepID=UPI00217F2C73|nr:uncharacterized protein LOC126834381 [Adelges cooleyi]
MNYNILLFGCTACVCLTTVARGQYGVSFASNEDVNSTAAGNRSGKTLFNLLDSSAGPYQAAANGACLQGDMVECFKAKALSRFDEFFVEDAYRLNDNVRMIHLQPDHNEYWSSRTLKHSIGQQPKDTEWDRLVRFTMHKTEMFLRSTAVEVQVPDELTEGGRYSPRFIDDSELDAIENKKAKFITKKKVKKFLVPPLILLKLFKMKLLLFLPLVLGLAPFKKILGFLAFVGPGLIGLFKSCKPHMHHNYGMFGHSSFF